MHLRAAQTKIRLRREPKKHKLEDEEEEYKPLRKKRRLPHHSKTFTFEDFCNSNFPCRLRRGGKMAEKAKREMIARFVDPAEQIDPEIIDLNINRMLEIYETRHDWYIDA
ncbi:hypothetical protein PsunGV_gp171 [Pseudalatia unipuncta granulovirus]|uniref:Uncharacterized protein n=1 Tax=Pseudalatia unipuncta granulosis virus TaxID=36355 RepID=B6S740_GVPU|nr:hypothetical protein PsunGV_gp171 [Pseudalatia unipuncta granulovirus]ACH69521.1 unknown [Pseudalatia unipuncta granulovirus]